MVEHFLKWFHAADIKLANSLISLLGKLLFCRNPAWEQRRKVIHLICSVSVGLILGGICAAMILFQQHGR